MPAVVIVQVTGLKLTHSGLIRDEDIKRVTIWDGLNRLNSYGEFSNRISDITFTSPLVIPSGQSKILLIKISISDTAPSGSQIKLSLLDIKTTQSVDKTFPVVPSTMTIVPAP